MAQITKTIQNEQPRSIKREVMGLIPQLSKRLLQATLPSRVLLVRGPRASKQTIEICLTFDDGPHPEHTPRLLDNLATFGLTGTFFIVGQRAEKYPELVRQIVDAGHELGNHTWTHSEPRETSTTQFMEEIRRTRHWIQDLTGRDCRLMRPPKGELTISKLWGLIKERQTIALWNQDPRDYRMESWCDMEDWCRNYQPAQGDIVLMHDIHPHAATAAVLFGSLPQLSPVRCVRLSDWLSPVKSQVVSKAGGLQLHS